MRTLKFNSHSSKLMYAHLKLTLGKTNADAIMHKIHLWMECNGQEWTVERLKSLKVWFLQILSGNTSYHCDWFSYEKLGTGPLIPKGVFNPLFRDAFASKHLHNKKIVKILSGLMVYTGVRLDKPSSKQIKKTLGSIQGPILDMDKRKSLLDYGETSLACNLRDHEFARTKLAEFKQRRKKGFRFTPVALNTAKPFVSGEKYLASFSQGLHIPLVRNYFEKAFENFPELKFPEVKPQDIFEGADYSKLPISGRIVVIQEGGAKARVVATPSTAAQVALYPLHELLNSFLKELVTDCTHDQETGAQWALSQLQSGKRLHSVDLSGATDNFPLSLQLGVLNGLGLTAEAKLIHQLATGIWILHPDLITDELVGSRQMAVTYSNGQPQGLYSSFPLFGLTHNLLVTELCKALHKEPDECFRILGDDIVISDEQIHTEYRAFMEKVGVPISEQKSIVSNTMAEFAGYVITPKGYFKPAKVPNPFTPKPLENNFYNYLKVVGQEGIKYLPSKVRKLADKVMLLPEWLGGLGYNPKGLSYEDRTKSFLEKTDDKDMIPTYHSMSSNFIVMGASGNIPEYASEALNWVHDQWTLYDNHVKSIIQHVPSLSRMCTAGITEPHSVAYQLSALAGCADGRVLVGNKAKQNSNKPFTTDFDIWRKKFAEFEDITPIRVNVEEETETKCSEKRSHQRPNF